VVVLTLKQHDEHIDVSAAARCHTLHYGSKWAKPFSFP
jgi:hypothetical protein